MRFESCLTFYCVNCSSTFFDNDRADPGHFQERFEIGESFVHCFQKDEFYVLKF